MSDSVYLGLGARQLEDSPTYQPISCVQLTIGGEDANGNPIVCTAGNPNSGRTIETSNPLIWDASVGNTVAQNILAAIQGYAYRPFTADGAIINPAVEIGDAVEVGDVYSVIADVETSFTPLMSANISAPQGSDIDHEYPYESSENRELMQQLQGLKTSFVVENGRIAAEISDMSTDMNGLSNRISSIEMTADSISASLSAYATTEWVNSELSTQLTLTANSITSSVSRTYETKTDATNKLNTAKSYADTQDNSVKGTLRSEIQQTADSIRTTVAAQESKWDTTGLTISAYGYGVPSNTTASQYNGKYYLDQSSGRYYRSNGTSWVLQSTQLKLITSQLDSRITQQAGLISSTVSSVSALGNRVSAIEQTSTSISMTVSSQNGVTQFQLFDDQAVLDTQNVFLTVDAAHISGTLIADTLRANSSIISPTIYDSTQSYWLNLGYNGMYCGLQFSKYSGSGQYRIFGIYDGDFGYVSLNAKGFNFVTIDGSSNYVRALGTWDFRYATQIIFPDGTHIP